MQFKSTLASLAIIAIATSITLSGCGGDKTEELNKLSAEHAQFKQRLDAIDAEIKQLKAHQLETTVQTASSSPAEVKPAAADATSGTLMLAVDRKDAPAAGATPSAPAATKTFADISGVFGEESIRDLVKLGAIAPGNNFEPSKPISRAQFVAWLVTANNLMRPDNFIRLAEASDSSTFKDLPTSHPLFKYIQGMANAGWSIGYKDGTFRPDKAMTREEMIAIKALFDRPFIPSNDYPPTYSDANQISKDFWHAWCVEKWNQLNFERIYGQTKVCNPRKPVTRAEAAVCVSQIGYQPKVTVAAVLKK